MWLDAGRFGDNPGRFSEWGIKKRGDNPDNISLIKVSGDSIAPPLLAGDLWFRSIMAASPSPHRASFCAICIDSEIMIERVHPVFPDKILVISDNKHYPSFEMAAENVRINGKVIWYARELERWRKYFPKISLRIRRNVAWVS